MNQLLKYVQSSLSRNGDKKESFRGPRTLAELKDFVKDISATNSDMEEDDDISVVELDKDNFEDEIETGTAVVQFYADWCRHCKKLLYTWELLAERYKGS